MAEYPNIREKRPLFMMLEKRYSPKKANQQDTDWVESRF